MYIEYRIFFLLTACFVGLTDINAQDRSTLFDGNDVIITRRGVDKLVLLHPVAKGQTLYSISKYYGTSLSAVRSINFKLRIRPMRVGDTLSIPILASDIKQDVTDDVTGMKRVFYRVQSGDTEYGLAKRVLKLDLEFLQQLIEFSGSELSPNEEIQVGFYPREGIQRSSRLPSNIPTSIVEKNLANKESFIKKRSSKKIYRQQMLCTVTKSGFRTSSSRGLFCAHRTLKPGTFIKVRNPMNNRELYLKVIAEVSDDEEQDILINIPQHIASMLGVVDHKFGLRVEYYE